MYTFNFLFIQNLLQSFSLYSIFNLTHFQLTSIFYKLELYTSQNTIDTREFLLQAIILDGKASKTYD